MAIAFDAASTAKNGSVTSLTWSHTCTGSDRALVVRVSMTKGSGEPIISSVTYNGVAMTGVGSLYDGGRRKVAMYVLVAPATGANNIVVTFSAEIQYVVGGADSWTGINQATPNGTASGINGSSTTPSRTIASAVDEVVVDVLHADAQTATVGASQTQRWNDIQGDTRGCGSSEPGAASVTMSWTLGGSASWIIACVSLKPAAAAATTRSGSTVILNAAQRAAHR